MVEIIVRLTLHHRITSRLRPLHPFARSPFPAIAGRMRWVPSPAIAGADKIAPMISPLLTDLYQLNMAQAYLDHGETDTAVFEFFARTLPARRGFLLAAGLEQALDFLEKLRFSADEIAWLKSTGRFKSQTCSIICAISVSAATCTPCPKARCSSPTSRSCG